MDGLRATTFLNLAQSTLESFQNNLQNRKSDVLVDKKQILELQEQLQILIPRYIDDETRLINLLTISDQISLVLQILEDESLDSLDSDEHYSDDFHGLIDDRNPVEEIKKEEIQQPIRQKREDDGNPIECPICFDEYPFSECYELDCSHMYCKECLQHYLKGLITTADVANIKCPNPECTEPILYFNIKDLVDEEVFAKYERFSLLSMLNADPTARHCPNVQCQSICTGEPLDPESPCCTCPACGQDFCYDCKTAWHPGITCAKAKCVNELESLDPKTKKWMSKHKVKQCPNCGMPAQRIAGCPDMICSGCKTHWDWNSVGENSEDEEETTLEKVAFFYPRLIKECVFNRETAESWNNDRTETVKDLALPLAVISAVGIPVFAIAGGPALAARKYRRGKKFLKKLRSDKEQN